MILGLGLRGCGWMARYDEHDMMVLYSRSLASCLGRYFFHEYHCIRHVCGNKPLVKGFKLVIYEHCRLAFYIVPGDKLLQCCDALMASMCSTFIGSVSVQTITLSHYSDRYPSEY